MNNMTEKTNGLQVSGAYSQEHERENEPLYTTTSKQINHEPVGGWQRFRNWLGRVWAYEAFSVIVAIGAFCGMIGFLLHLDNQPLTSWTAKLSPNTVLSILSTLCKATLLTVISACIAQLRWVHYKTAPQKLGDIDTFANASKGPVGSIKLFLGISKRHNSGRLACFAAFLIILAIVIDPFAQQVLKYQVEQIAATNLAATIPVTKGVGNTTTIIDNSRAWQGLYAGILGFDYPLPYQCISGNCTWPDFDSLGVCASCQNATPFAITVANGTTIQQNIGNLSLVLKNGSAPSSQASTEANSAFTLVKSVVSEPYPRGLSDPTIFEFVMAQLLVNLNSNVKPNNFTPAWNISQCSVHWCGRVYSDVKVTKGNFSQAEPRIVNLQPDTTSSCYGKTLCQAFVANDSTVNMTYKINFRQDASNIRQLLNFDQDANTFPNNTWDFADSFSVTATLFWLPDISTSISRATNTFTDFMRSQRPTYATGITYITTTYIRVRWGWLALPAAIVVCTLILLVIVAIVNRGTTLWKGSSLPLIFHPVEYRGQHNLGAYHTDPDTITKQAEAMEVRLEQREDGGLKFTMMDRDGKNGRS